MGLWGLLFGRKNSVDISKTTPVFQEWKAGVIRKRAEIKKMGHSPILESDSQLLVSYFRSTRLSPFLGDNNAEKIKGLLAKHGPSSTR